MWISETKQLICETVWLGSGSTNNTAGVTINTPGGITLIEGIRIKADKNNTDAIYLRSDTTNSGNYTLHGGEEVFLPISTPSTLKVAASANTVNYSFIGW